ncbi:MAG: 1-deoxy-D-xylulose-5-phosphate reductoisomerase [Hyphomicrobiaceae bacterium]|nr:1-deoxy-D-xylulose-5-phosphate reductoisomerase [Hyphomicrobiaceae bacterium]
MGQATTTGLGSAPRPAVTSVTDAPPMRLTVMGATGSIGLSTLDLIGRNPGRFTIAALTAHSNVDELAELAIAHRAELAVIGHDSLYGRLVERLAGSGIAVAAGRAGLMEAAARPADCLLAAIVGAAGLEPAYAALGQGKRLALANKECLVSAGAIFMAEAARQGVEILPVDSEHSGAFQALVGARGEDIEQIVLTASGGPFREWPLERIAQATRADALRHPNWSMGAKITVDSATMMNKGLELIEAYHLFDVPADRLGVVVHPQSIVHCLVAYRDGSVIAQLAEPDMRTPIALALSWPRRMTAPTKRLDLAAIGTLTFEPPDETRFPCLRLARAALAAGGTMPAVLNAANEIAVAAFLEGRIGVLDIAATVDTSLEAAVSEGLGGAASCLEDVLLADAAGRRLAAEALGSLRG